MGLFFFGSLMDLDLLRVVVGHDCAGVSARPASLRGYRTNRVKDDDYPVLVAQDDGIVQGRLIEGLEAEDIARIRYFEDDEYALETGTVETAEGPVECLFCLARDVTQDSGEPWTASLLTGEARELFLLMTEEHMAHYGRTPMAEAAAQWDEFRERALARLAARRRDGSG